MQNMADGTISCHIDQNRLPEQAIGFLQEIYKSAAIISTYHLSMRRGYP
jgi:hypothetical protein